MLHPCIGFGIGLGHTWGHANAWIWYIHAYAWILYIHVLSHISHIPKAEVFGFMFQYLSSERMGLRFWANPIPNTWLDHGEILRTRCTPFCPVMFWAQKARKVVWWFHWLFTLCNIKFTGITLMFPFQNYKLFYFLMKVPFDCLGPHRDFDMLFFLCVNVRVKKELFLSRRWTM